MSVVGNLGEHGDFENWGVLDHDELRGSIGVEEYEYLASRIGFLIACGPRYIVYGLPLRRWTAIGMNQCPVGGTKLSVEFVANEKVIVVNFE